MRTSPFGMQDLDSSELEDAEEQELEQKKKKRRAQSSMFNMVHFENCDMENATIIMNFEGPD